MRNPSFFIGRPVVNMNINITLHQDRYPDHEAMQCIHSLASAQLNARAASLEHVHVIMNSGRRSDTRDRIQFK
jgi:hypothetical protein